MTPEKVIEVVERYRQEFIRMGIAKSAYHHDDLFRINSDLSWDYNDALRHCHNMLDQMVQFVKEGRMEKTFRWLGFIQGVLWANGIYTLAELQNHNKPPDA